MGSDVTGLDAVSHARAASLLPPAMPPCTARATPTLIIGTRRLALIGIVDAGRPITLTRRCQPSLAVSIPMGGAMSKDVLVIIGAGGMGTAVARRLGPGRLIVLADVNVDGL